MMAVSEILISG